MVFLVRLRATMKLLCHLRTIWLTLTYPREGIFAGLVLSGHEYVGTGAVHDDHWEIVCLRCGKEACSEIQP